MKFSIKHTEVFAKQVKRLKKKYNSLKEELEELENQLKQNPFLGTSLGHHTYKIRLGIKSKGKGKSGGLRIITYVVDALNNVYLFAIYDKSEIGNIENSLILYLTKQIDEENKILK
jgi:mRNA-degrading endonuclease RelE of RelBE toxin-antitoxin system